ncbi:MAG: cell envelope integrity protein CreD, partial [Saprospiraceae bacterium]|nr:cell envelope integrity protein CreD [Saprospiraceae bacterium]
MNIPEKMNKSIAQKIKESVMLKIITILFLCLLLMIPVASVQSLIRERSGLKNQIENDVAKAYGQSQNIVPPVLKIPYSRTISDDDDKKKITNGFITVTPDMVEIDGDINTDKRKRSIYEVIVYKSALNLKGKILLPNLEKHEIDEYKFDYAGAYISIGLSDNNGLYEDLFITINGESFELSPGLIQDPLMITSLSTDALGIEDEHSLNFEMNLKVKGTRSIKFAPVARNAQVNLKSEWHSPSFIGSSLPQSYDITEEGFNSKWTTNQYNRDFPHYWFDGHYDFKKINKSFGVSLIEPIDGYGKNNRSSKYALLIIALTFGIFFFFEIMYKKNIHPIQYTM